MSQAPEWDEDGSGLFAPGRRALSIGSIALISMLAFEALAITTAMPVIASALGGLDRYALAFGATLATSVIGMVIAGTDCDRRGPLRSMGWGLALFAAGLLVAGLAPTMGWLIAGRTFQGLGSGLLAVSIYAAVGRLYPARLRPRIFAMFAAAWVVPAVVGPLFASLIVEWLGWPWIFLGIALLLPPVAWLVLPPISGLGAPVGQSAGAGTLSTRVVARRIAHAVLAAMAALVLHDYTHAPDRAHLLQGVLASAALLYSARALLPRGSLSARPGLPTVILLRGLLAGAFYAAEAFLPLWLVLQHGWSPAQAGLALTAGALMWSFGSAWQSRVVEERGRRRLLQGGFSLVAASIGAIAVIAASNGWPLLAVPAWAIVGLGTGMAFPSISVLMLQLSAEHEQGSHSSALQLSDALITTALLALCAALFALLGGTTMAFAAVFGLAALAAMVAALLAPRTQPAAAWVGSALPANAEA